MRLSKTLSFHHSIILLALGLMVSTQSLAQQDGRYYHTHMWDGGWHGWVFGPIMMILFIGLLVIAGVLLARWLGPGGRDGSQAFSPKSTPEKTPLDILKERFARGEIDKAEFEERRRVLEE